MVDSFKKMKMALTKQQKEEQAGAEKAVAWLEVRGGGAAAAAAADAAAAAANAAAALMVVAERLKDSS